jgi:hypothetical protein
VAPAPPDSGRVTSSKEIIYWNDVKDTKNIPELKEFVRQFPKSEFASLAKVRIANLEKSAAPEEIMETTKSVGPSRLSPVRASSAESGPS